MICLGENVLETRMTSKGQVLILKEIRERLGLSKRQQFIERTKDNKVILEPVPNLVDLGGTLKSMGKNKSIKQLMKEVKEGWD